MAAVNFPNSPVDGDTFTYEGKTFEWSASNGIWVRKPNGPIPEIITVDAPVISGVNTAPELSVISLTISNYDLAAIYIVSVTGGSFVRSTDTITWTLPIADGQDEIHTLLIYASKSGVGMSPVTQHEVLVTDEFLNVQADTSIIIGNFGLESTHTDWEI